MKTAKPLAKDQGTNAISSEDLAITLLREDFPSFFHMFFELLNPTKELGVNWHIDAIAYELDLIYRGLSTRLIINVPPRTLKSTLVSVAYVAWYLGRHPEKKVVVISYSKDLAIRLARDFRTIIEHPLYKALFPKMRISRSKNTETETVTSKGGGRFSVSLEGSITGRGADLIIIDDPNKPDEQSSASVYASINEIFDNTIASRLDDPKKGQIIVVMQRLHQNDLSGYLLAKGGYRHLSIPIRAEEQLRFKLATGRTKVMKRGEPMHPGRMDIKAIDQKMSEVGARIFSAQYMQQPVPASGNIFKTDWVKYAPIPERRHCEAVYLSVDTALKAGPANDFTAVTVWGEKDGKLYLLFMKRERWEFPDLHRNVKILASSYDVDGVLIEDKGSGTSLIQEMDRESRFSIISCAATVDKETRANAATLMFESGQVIFPENADFMPEVLHELLGFPNHAHDDIVDSLSQMMNWYSFRRKKQNKVYFGSETDLFSPYAGL